MLGVWVRLTNIRVEPVPDSSLTFHIVNLKDYIHPNWRKALGGPESA